MCAALVELAELDALSSQALGWEWDDAQPVLTDNLRRTDEAYQIIVDEGSDQIAAAATDLLAFDERIVASGALEADDADGFIEALDGLEGSAEAGAADTVLREHAQEACT